MTTTLRAVQVRELRGLDELALTPPLAGDGVPPLVQVTETVTEAELLSEKFLLTVKVALFRVFVIVQLAVPPLLIATPAHPAWLAV